LDKSALQVTLDRRPRGPDGQDMIMLGKNVFFAKIPDFLENVYERTIQIELIFRQKLKFL
jgi:hypothetical protein